LIVGSEEDRRRLAQLIKDRALRFGEFTLASGQTSSYYIDGKQVSLAGEGLYLLASQILEHLPPEVEAIGGMAIGADPISAATAAIAASMGRKLDAFIVRKEPKDHGTGRQVEGPLSQGARVAMVEDTVTTGGSTISAIERIRDEGFEIAGVLSLVDRLSGGGEAIAAAAAAPYEALTTIDDIYPDRPDR